MIKNLTLHNIGPAARLELGFGKRLNILTGDNGLGKSFLLDIAWWALTRRWPAEINAKLTAGRKALPAGEGEAKIAFTFVSKTREESYESTFVPKEQSWRGRPGRPANPGLVLYAMSDGSFAVWDPQRNYWVTRDGVDVQERIPAYVFSPMEVWDGLQAIEGNWLCNGLIRDWAGWQKERGAPFESLKQILAVLSPSPHEVLQPGELTRVSFDDVRDIPTLRMAYGQDVPVVHASSGMRRIVALAYFLVWAWEEHKKAALLAREQQPTQQITFLVDEIESHLHPSWQRRIVPAIISVVDRLAPDAEVQLITATHSPLIMASVEPLFDPEQDAWFDLDFESQTVVLRQRDFEKQGNVTAWLTSEAFDLKSSRPIEYERLVEEASLLLNRGQPGQQELRAMYQRLLQALSPKDDFLFRWRAICDRRGWKLDSCETPT